MLYIFVARHYQADVSIIWSVYAVDVR